MYVVGVHRLRNFQVSVEDVALDTGDMPTAAAQYTVAIKAEHSPAVGASKAGATGSADRNRPRRPSFSPISRPGQRSPLHRHAPDHPRHSLYLPRDIPDAAARQLYTGYRDAALPQTLPLPVTDATRRDVRDGEGIVGGVEAAASVADAAMADMVDFGGVSTEAVTMVGNYLEQVANPDSSDREMGLVTLVSQQSMGGASREHDSVGGGDHSDDDDASSNARQAGDHDDGDGDGDGDDGTADGGLVLLPSWHQMALGSMVANLLHAGRGVIVDTGNVVGVEEMCNRALRSIATLYLGHSVQQSVAAQAGHAINKLDADLVASSPPMHVQLLTFLAKVCPAKQTIVVA